MTPIGWSNGRSATQTVSWHTSVSAVDRWRDPNLHMASKRQAAGCQAWQPLVKCDVGGRDGWRL